MNRLTIVWLRVLVFLFSLGMTGLAAAQEAVTPIDLGQNLTGAVTVEAPTARFVLTADAAQTARVQVLSLAPDYFPTLHMISPSGIEILNAENPEQELILDATILLGEVGTYGIEVGSASGNGQFVLSVLAGDPLPTAVDLVAGQPLEESVDVETPIRLYRFETVANENVMLSIMSLSSEGSPVVAVRDEATGMMLSMSALDASGMTALIYHFASGAASTLVEVSSSGASAAEMYRICLWTPSAPGDCAESGTGAANSVLVVSPTAQVGSPAAGAASATPINGADCEVMSATGGSINVRRGPSTNTSVVGNLSGTQTEEVIGRLADQSWYQISFNGQAAWVGSTVVVLVGTCGSVPIVPAPLVPTVVATTQPNQATPTVTVMTPSATLTTGLTATTPPTATATEPGVPPTLPMFEPVDTRPDLNVNSISFVQVSDNFFRLRIAIFNIGASNVGAYTGRICINELCADRTFEGHPASEYIYHTYDVDIRVSGTVINVVYAVDFANDVDEADETNNLHSEQIDLLN